MMEQGLIEYMVNALWQLPLLAGGAWTLLRIVRPAPAMQHRVWLAVLALAVLLPLHGMGGAGVSTTRQTSLAAQQPGSPTLTQSTGQMTNPWVKYAFHTSRIRLSGTTTHCVVGLYAATIVIGLFRIARAWRGARQLVESSREMSLSPRDGRAFEEIGQRFGVQLPQLRESAEISSPMVVGIEQPVLLLPAAFDQYSQDEVRAALCHELAHVQRGDYLVNVICELASLPLTWHPVVYEVQQRIRMTREMVCDAMAAEQMKSQIGYARCLLALAQSMLGEGGLAAPGHLPGLFSRNTLEERVMRLMETTTTSLRASVARVATGAAVMIATGAMATAFI